MIIISFFDNLRKKKGTWEKRELAPYLLAGWVGTRYPLHVAFGLLLIIMAAKLPCDELVSLVLSATRHELCV